MKLAFVISIVVASVAALFAVQNAQYTQVSFLGWYFEAPLVMILLITFASGAVSALLAMLPGSVRQTFEVKHLKSQLQSQMLTERKEALPLPSEVSQPFEAPMSEPTGKQTTTPDLL